MTPRLPNPITAYFKADESSGEAVARCFTEDAVVKDEGHIYNGRAAIKKWKDDSSAKYVYTRALLGCEPQAGKVVVTCRLKGKFPGSPVDLRFIFGLESEKIASLEIVP